MPGKKITVGKREGKMVVTATSTKPSLAKRVRKLESKTKEQVEWLNLRGSGSTSIAQQYQYPLCNFSNYLPVFGTSTDDLSDNQVLYHSFRSHINVTLENTNNEEETIRFSCFLVSLKDIFPQSRLNTTTGQITLTQDVDYTFDDGIVYLNSKNFKIHKRKYFTLTNYGTSLGTSAAQNQFGTNQQWNWDMKIKKKIKSGQGNWPLACALEMKKNYFILIFSNNNTSDAEYPSIKINSMHNFIKLN